MGSLWVIHKPVWQSGVISHWHCPALPQSRSDVDVQRYLECSALPWGRGGLELSSIIIVLFVFYIYLLDGEVYPCNEICFARQECNGLFFAIWWNRIFPNIFTHSCFHANSLRLVIMITKTYFIKNRTEYQQILKDLRYFGLSLSYFATGAHEIHLVIIIP